MNEEILSEYNFIGIENEGLLLCEKNGKFGFLNNIGEVVIEIKYLSSGIFRNGECNVYCSDRKCWIVINEKGEYLRDYEREKLVFNYFIGDIVNYVYKDSIESGEIIKINKEKGTFTVKRNDGSNIWRRFEWCKGLV